MNRAALGLAVGAGYVLGRTKKMKLAFAVGTMVAGKRLKLSPRAIADLVSTQLQNNPQFKEIGDQLREDLRGVGQAATGALVERQIEGLAGRLHDRTAGVRDQIAGVAPDPDDVRDAGRTVTGVVTGRRSEEDEEDQQGDQDEQSAKGDDTGRRRPSARAAGRSRPKDEPRSGRSSGGAARKPAAKKTAAKTATKRTAAKKTTRTATNAAKGGRGRG